MDCLVQLAATICLIQPSQLTLRADVSSQVAGEFTYTDHGRDFHGGHIGRVSLEMPLLSYRGFSLNAGYEHTSLLDTGRDRGQERAFLGLQWRPFR